MSRSLKSTTSIIALAAVLGLATSASQAADLPPAALYSAPVPFAISWHGFYLGAHTGWGEVNMDGAYQDGDPQSEVAFDNLDLSGIIGGLHAGYNWDMGNWVLGVEADVTGDWLDSEQSPTSSENAEAEVDMLASIRGRIGVPLGPERRTLVYGTAGVAWADADLEVRNPSVPSQETLDFNDIGAVIGAGAEWAATDRIRLRAEGLYYWFDDKESINSGSAHAGDFGELEDALVVRVGATWYFNTP